MSRLPGRVGVLFGGPSPEHDVSILTGLQAARELIRAGSTDVVALYWAKDGAWHEVPADSEAKVFLEGPPSASQPVQLVLGPEGGFVRSRRGRLSSRQEAVGIDAGRRTPRIEKVSGELVAGALDPIITTIGRSVQELLSDIPSGLAEDVLRGKIRLSGGGALLPGLVPRIEAVGELNAVVAEDPLRCVVRGAAMMMELEDKDGIPGLRQ